MKRVLAVLIVFILGGAAGYGIFKSGVFENNVLSPLGIKPIETPLYDYSIESLRNKQFVPKKIEMVKKMLDGEGYTSWLFKFETEEGVVSGQANLPGEFLISNYSNFLDDSRQQKYPIIIMIRGYVDKEEYQTGVGTKNAAAYFAKNGFITLAPDFLGYGESDSPPQASVELADLEERFIRPATVMQLIADIPSPRLGIWGHSNGGQIALSVLEITDRVIPTTLWAPVSKPFPYSVLYYTDEAEDGGKYLINIISEFEKIYDAEKFSLTNYFDLIKSPIQLHQGTGDESVPVKWSTDLASNLRKEKVEVNYFTYSGADHNMKPGWDMAIRRDLQFFQRELLPRP